MAMQVVTLHAFRAVTRYGEQRAFPTMKPGSDMALQLRSSSRQLWQTLSSIKTGVILLIVVVLVSAAGTLILQRPMTEPDEMQRAYSPRMLRFLDAAGLTDVFHSWWFVLLLVLVSLSIVAASLQRFPNSWRFFSRPYKRPDESFRRALATQAQFSIPDQEIGLVAAEHAFKKMGFKPERVVENNRTTLFAERHRVSHLAVYFVHASLLLIFAGWIIDGVFGWRGAVTLVPGQQVSQLDISEGRTRQLPFILRCDGAGQENYADGTPKRWWSKLAVIENGREITRKEIVVNDPLVYRSVRFYQASYGETGDFDTLKLLAIPKAANRQSSTIILDSHQEATLDSQTRLRVVKFIPDFVVQDGQVYSRSRELVNPAAQVELVAAAGTTTNFWVGANDEFPASQDSPYRFRLTGAQMAHFTGLQVSHEPGQWAVWAGCILMGVGLAAAFYVVHTRLWAVTVHDARGHLTLWVGGAANKNREVFQERFAQISERIQEELKQTRKEQPGAPDERRAMTLAGV
jgi:cytochrome c biogenesis protein